MLREEVARGKELRGERVRGLLDRDDDGVVLEAVCRPEALHRVRRHVHHALDPLDEADEPRLRTAEVADAHAVGARRQEPSGLELGVDVGRELFGIEGVTLAFVCLVAVVRLSADAGSDIIRRGGENKRREKRARWCEAECLDHEREQDKGGLASQHEESSTQWRA